MNDRLQGNGWSIFAHPLFLTQVETLANQVATLRHKDRDGYARKNASKRGYPPSDWDQLVSEAKPEVDRLERIARALE